MCALVVVLVQEGVVVDAARGAFGAVRLVDPEKGLHLAI